MKIIVVGAGSVGYTVAETLSSVHNVLVIEGDGSRADNIKDLLNVSVLHEDGTNPQVLRDSIIKHGADMVISSLPNDDTNLFVCMTAKMMFPDLKTVARVRHPDFIQYANDGTFKGADQILSPEYLSARKLALISQLENAIDYEDLGKVNLVVVTFLVTKAHTNIIGKIVINLPIPEGCKIVTVNRGDEVIINNETTELHAGDGICVIGDPESVKKFNKMLGYEREAKEVAILGGGAIGSQAAKMLEDKMYVKIIETDYEKSRKLARDFSSALVINASAVDPHTLRAENVGRADVVISATDSDEMNLLASLMAMEMGARKVVSRYTKKEYKDVFRFTGIQVAIGYHLEIANEITKTMISDENSILKMRHNGEAFFSAQVDDTLAGKRLGDVRLPDGAKILCIIRKDEKIYPRLDTKMAHGDTVLIFAFRSNVPKLKKMFEINVSPSS